MDYTIAEQENMSLEKTSTVCEYISGYETIMTPVGIYDSLPILSIPILERLTNALYGQDLLNMKLKKLASGSPSLKSIWQITYKLSSLTDLLVEERNNE